MRASCCTIDGSSPTAREKDFILNREPYRHARIIVADRNWGTGSSRESAVYALYEFGIRCVIASSFGDIHAANCTKNGLLPVVLPEADVVALRRLLHGAPGAMLNIDLPAQTVTDPDGRQYGFEIHPARKQCLLKGLDDISRTEQYEGETAAFEATYRAERPWLYSGA